LKSSVSGATLAANRLSFFSLCLYVPNSWAAAASDYYVYYPPSTPKWKTFLLTFAGLALSFWFVDLLGIGLACGIVTNSDWSDAYDISSGALLVAGYGPLGGFGKFCAVVIALGVIANCVPGTYSAAIGCQIMGRWAQVLPRWMWVVFLVAIQLSCALTTHNLFIIFSNFLALMGYWLMVMICIVLEEHLIFKPVLSWERWADRDSVPIGIAALVAFLLGWVGAVLGMNQTWFVGPLAKACGTADVGMWVGCAFALVVFPPLRLWEKRRFGR
jgi:purine-cytosine permease-like protein